jgi:hypothetical protein
MNIQQLNDQRHRLSKIAARRYVEREQPREARLREVEDKGVLAAAGTQAAVRRTAHMSLAEGRGLLEGKTFEAIVDVYDSDSVNFVLRGTFAARAVCRLVVDRQPIGTGFLVAPGVLLTNNHVIRDGAAAADFNGEVRLRVHDRGSAPSVAGAAVRHQRRRPHRPAPRHPGRAVTPCVDLNARFCEDLPQLSG